jgi:hypothetical protein
MKEWKRTVNERTFFSQDFSQGEIFMVDGYFYGDDVIYYAQERGFTVERVLTSQLPQEYKEKTKAWLFFTVVNTRFQLPVYNKTKPIETSLAEIL